MADGCGRGMTEVRESAVQLAGRHRVIRSGRIGASQRSRNRKRSVSDTEHTDQQMLKWIRRSWIGRNQGGNKLRKLLTRQSGEMILERRHNASLILLNGGARLERIELPGLPG